MSSEVLLSIPQRGAGLFLPTLFIPQKVPEMLPVPTTVEVDAYGFLPLDALKKYHMTINNRNIKVGYGYHCRTLCRFIQKVQSRQISHKRTGHYYCATCEIAMRCNRCHCCSRLGRAEPRTRGKRLSRKDVKFVD